MRCRSPGRTRRWRSAPCRRTSTAARPGSGRRLGGAAQQQALPRIHGRVDRPADGLILRVVELVADTADALVLLAGALARVEHAAALVHVGAHLEHLVEREPVGVAGGSTGLAGDDVVARVPDDALVVAEHAELVRRGPVARVDVVDVGADPVLGQRGEVVLQVLRAVVPWTGDAPV